MKTVLSLCATHEADIEHAHTVAHHALRIFDAAASLHGCSTRERELLEAGALLHDVGLRQDPPQHHIAGRDIIIAAHLTGFEHNERAMIACLAAFHRSTPDIAHESLFLALNAAQQRTVLLLSALVRIADGLDRSHTHSTAIDELEVDSSSGSDACVIRTSGPHSHADAAAADVKADLWRECIGPVRIYGRLTSPGLTADMPLPIAGQSIMRYHADQVTHDEWTAADPAASASSRLKTMRITVRRLRLDMAAFAPYFKPHFKAKRLRTLAEGARTLSHALSAPREMDMLITRARASARPAVVASSLRSGDAKTLVDSADVADATDVADLVNEWKTMRRAARGRLTDYLTSKAHARWHAHLVEFFEFSRFDANEWSPGEPTLMRHVWPSMLWNHLCAVRAFDVLPALPSSEHLHELRVAVKRLHYFVDAVREVLPETLTQTLTAACAELQKNLGEVNDAHTAALYSLEFIVRDRTMRKSQIQNVMQFAATQQDIVNERAPQWKTLLDPLLTIGM